MARSKDFIEGWSMGWTAATDALLRSLDRLTVERGASTGATIEAVRMEAAGNKPTEARRRGRPPKPATASDQQPRRKRGRPPKSP